MRLLAIDTATEACSAALWLDGETHACFEVAGRSHTQRLPPMVARLLAETGLQPVQLDALVCSVGPGSFAGIRIGVGYAKGLAMALDLPVLGVSTLAMLAQRALDGGAGDVLSVIDARMGQVYVGAFERSREALAVPCAEIRLLAPEQAADALAPIGDAQARRWHAVGSGWQAHGDALLAAFGLTPVHVDAQALPDARDGLRLALPELIAGRALAAEQLEPIYLRDRVALNLTEQAIARQADRR